MEIFLVDADQTDVKTRKGQWVFRRAAVISIGEEAAVQCVVQGLRGCRVFTGNEDENLYARPSVGAYFNPDICVVTPIGFESDKPVEELRSRILAWELCAPEDSKDDPDFAA